MFHACYPHHALLFVKERLTVQDLYGCNPMMKVIPVEWEHVMPVGILYYPEPTEEVDRFLTVTKEVLNSKKDRL